MQGHRPFDDTIVAPATAPGHAAISLLRISGSATSDLLAQVLRHRDPGAPRERVARLARFVDPVCERALDEVMVTFFAAPRSYTGEDVAEIGFHGNPYIIAEALRVLESLGARPASRGEFTRRAVRNGKLDLARAEAVAELCDASSHAAARLAVRHLSGELSERYRQLHESARTALALLEGPLEFPDDVAGDEARAAEAADRSLHGMLDCIAALTESHGLGRRVTRGTEVALAGRSNVGKSSVFNRLVEEDRALVSPRSGTTRDWIDATVTMDGRLVRLVDTAGYGDAPDPLDVEASRRSRQCVERADLALLVFDSSVPLTPDDQAACASRNGRAALVVLNKCDLPPRTGAADLAALCLGAPIVEVSAATGSGIDGLRKQISTAVGAGLSDIGERDSIVTSARQASLLARAAQELDRARTNVAGGSSELAVEDIRGMIRLLDEMLTGVSDEELLDAVFDRFCIGK